METSTFVKQLGSNNRKVRENALETLKKYLNTKTFRNVKQIQYDKLWKGLYFAMWFSDRPRPQQRLANELGNLYQLYFNENDNKKNNKNDEITENDKAFIKFSKAFWKIMLLQWYDIDYHRIDKFLLLVRRVVFNQLKYLQEREWFEPLITQYINKVLKRLPLSGDKKVYNGIPMHLTDIILDEWERLITGKDDENEEEDNEEEEEKEVVELIKQTPLKSFIQIFQDLSNDIDNSKVLRDYIKKELLSDTRLLEWEIIEMDNKGDTEEWKGFGTAE